MPRCQNCGEYVTKQYVRVFVPDEVGQPRVCPHCDDKIRDNGKPRERHN